MTTIDHLIETGRVMDLGIGEAPASAAEQAAAAGQASSRSGESTSQRMDYDGASPKGMQALGGVYGHIMQSSLPKALVELVYLRISQINGCAYCIDLHSRELFRGGLAIEKLVLVQNWREGGRLFDEIERAALAWAETVTLVAQTGVPEAEYEAAAAMFDAGQLADLTIAIGLMNAYNRMAISFRKPPAAAA